MIQSFACRDNEALSASEKSRPLSNIVRWAQGNRFEALTKSMTSTKKFEKA